MEIDSIIIGAGPAGVQLAYFFETEYPTEYLILERSDIVGAFFKTYPRQRNLISINKLNTFNFRKNTLRHDWNSLITHNTNVNKFSDYSSSLYPLADSLVDYLTNFKNHFNLRVQLNTTIQYISQDLNKEFSFEIKDTHNKIYHCKKVFVATGVHPKPIPEIFKYMSEFLQFELLDYATMPLDPEKYKNKSVFIIGTGNAAFETANYLNSFTESIAMVGSSNVAWKTHHPGHLRSINMAFLDTFYLKVGNAIFWDYKDYIDTILQFSDFLKASGSKLSYVIWCGGFQPDYSIFNQSIRPDTYPNGYPKLTATYESINIPNLYFIGTLMQGAEYKKGTAAFIHGFRYNIEFLAKYLSHSLQPKRITGISAIIEYILERLKTATNLYHRLSEFTDYMCIIGNNTVDYYESVPTRYVNEVLDMESIKHSYSTIKMTLDFGPKPFLWSLRQQDTLISNRANISQFLHPIFHIYDSQTKQVKTVHTAETLTSEFNVPEIHNTLIQYIIEFALSKMTQEDNIMLAEKTELLINTYFKDIDKRVQDIKDSFAEFCKI